MTSNFIKKLFLQSFVVLFIFVNVGNYGAEETDKLIWNIGSVLFKKGIREVCFGEYEKSLLAARMDLEKLLPSFKEEIPSRDKDFEVILLYFRKIRKNIEKMPRRINRNTILSAYYDVLGGYLKSFLIPTAKLSFYAGNTRLITVRHIISLYDECKTALDTKGIGWADSFIQFYNINQYVLPLYLSSLKEDCNELIISDEENGDENQLIALPKLERDEDSNKLTNIWLPFKRKHVYNLRSKQSAFIFMRYFTASKQCFEIEKVSITDFNKRLERWIINNVVPHLKDESVYAGLGGALRVLRTLKTNMSEPLYLGNKFAQHQFRRDDFNIVNDENDYSLIGSLSQTNLSSTKTLTQPQTESPLFTSDMMWITIISVLGVLIIVLILLCVQKCIKKQQMNNSAKLRCSDTTQKPNGGQRNKRYDSFQHRRSRNLPVSSGTSIGHPVEYINHPTTSAHIEKERTMVPNKTNRRKSFLTQLGSFKKQHINSTSNRAVFNVNSDIDSEEEIDLSNIATKKSTIELHTAKNSLDINLNNPTNNQNVNLQEENRKSPQKKTFTNFFLGNRKILDVVEQIELKTDEKSKLHLSSKNQLEKNTSKIKSRSLELLKPKEFFGEQNQYNFELSEWETIPE